MKKMTTAQAKQTQGGNGPLEDIGFGIPRLGS